MALILGSETKSLLIGEAVEKRKLIAIREIGESEEYVQKVSNILTIYFGPHNILLTLQLEFVHDISVKELHTTIRQIEKNVREKFPEIKRVFYEAAAVAQNELIENNS